MFISLETLKKVLNEVVNGSEDADVKVKSLKEKIIKLEGDLREIEHKKQLEERELSHLVKMKEEKQKLELDKKEVELSKTFNNKEMSLQKEYFEKTMNVINKEHQDIKEVYRQIMERLPNVNVEVKRK